MASSVFDKTLHYSMLFSLSLSQKIPVQTLQTINSSAHYSCRVVLNCSTKAYTNTRLTSRLLIVRYETTKGSVALLRFGVKWYVTALLLHFHEQIHSMMSLITHNCYWSNQHSEPDLSWGLSWNVSKPIRPARLEGGERGECDEFAGTVGLWPSGEKCVDTVFQLLNSEITQKEKKKKKKAWKSWLLRSGYTS